MRIGQMERGEYRPDEKESKTPDQIATEAIEKQHEAEEKFREELLTKERELFEEEIPEENKKEGLMKIGKAVRVIGGKVAKRLIPGFNEKLRAAVRGGVEEMVKLHLDLRICRLKFEELSDSDRKKRVESNLEEIKILNSRLEQEEDKNKKVEMMHSINELKQDNQVLEAFKQGIKLF